MHVMENRDNEIRFQSQYLKCESHCGTLKFGHPGSIGFPIIENTHKGSRSLQVCRPKVTLLVALPTLSTAHVIMRGHRDHAC